jgi:hypothetical protein
MSLPSKPLLQDEAEENATKFAFDDYSASLASVIKDKDLQTPFTVAIYGDWGSGKTTLMKTVAHKLEEKHLGEVGVKVIWFNAWEFEKLPTSLWTVFLNRIIMNLQDMMPHRKLKNQLKVLGKGFALLSTQAFLSRTAGIKLSDLEEIREQIWEDIKKIECLREELSSYIQKALDNDPQKRGRIAIFVDDLDRCLPKQCIDIFESIKLFLNCKNCIFVLGLDKKQIQEIFDQKFSSNIEKRGSSYIEKFVQLEFDLPPKVPSEVYEFILENAPKKLVQDNDLSLTLFKVSKFIEPNPRKIKRLLNSVMFLERLFVINQEKIKPSSRTEANLSLILIWLVIKATFPKFSIKVEANPTFLNEAITASKGNSREILGEFASDQQIIGWLSSLPNYDEDQLKNVIYLSRTTPSSEEAVGNSEAPYSDSD